MDILAAVVLVMLQELEQQYNLTGLNANAGCKGAVTMMHDIDEATSMNGEVWTVPLLCGDDQNTSTSTSAPR